MRQYRIIDAEINRLVAERDQWMTMATHITSNLSGMPHSGSVTRQTEVWSVKLAELDREIGDKIDDLVALRGELERGIDGIKDPVLQHLMRLRYIDGKTWEQIAVQMSYSYRQVTRMHGVALQFFQIMS